MRRYSPLLAALLVAGCIGDYFDPIDPADHAVVFAPEDTTVYVDETFQSRAFMANRFGDVYPSEHIEYEALDDAVGVSPRGLVTGRALGRGRVIARRSELRDTGLVTVVPRGMLALSVLGDDGVHLVTTQLDGSDVRAFPSTGGFETGATTWLPNGRIVYQRNQPGEPPVIEVASLGETIGPLLNVGGDTRAQQWPRASRDGEWVYFAWAEDIWRVHPDGSGLDSLTGGETPDADAHPDPSPDGSRLLFTSRRTGLPGAFALTIRDLATGVEQSLGVRGLVPRWSPDGAWIAYWSSGVSETEAALYLVRPDGSGLRRISAEGRRYRSVGLDWSPDGEWLVAVGDSTLELVRVASGDVLPLSWATLTGWPSWRP